MKIFFLIIIISVIFLLGGCGSKNGKGIVTDGSTTGELGKEEIIEENIDEEQFEKDIDTFDIFFDNSEFEAAINFGFQIIGKYPNNTRLLSRIGKSYKKLGDFENALKYLLQASKLTEDTDINVLYNLAVLYRDNSDLDNAKKYVDRILLLDPDYEKVQGFFDEGIEKLKNDPLSKARKLLQDKEYTKALEETKLLLTDKNNLSRAYDLMGEIYTELGDYVAAKKILTEGYTVTQGKDFEIVKSLGGANHRLSHTGESTFEEAEKFYLEALKLNPDDKRLSRLIEHNRETRTIDLEIKKVDSILIDDSLLNVKAKVILDKLNLQFPNDPGITSGFGRYYFEEKNFTQALKYFKTANQLFEGEDPYVLYLLGLTLYSLGNTIEGQEYLDQALLTSQEKDYPLDIKTALEGIKKK